MDTSIVLSVISLLIALGSLGLTFWVARRDEPRVRATAKFYPARREEEGPGGPPCLIIEIANFGRRVVQLESMYFQYDTTQIDLRETLWNSDETGHWRIREGDRYDHEITPESDSILFDETGRRVTKVFFQDSLGRRYVVRNLRKCLEAYLEQAKDW